MCGDALQIRLSDTASVAIKMPLKGRDSQPIQAVLTQQKFEQLSADLFRRARLPLDEACWQVFPVLCSSRALAVRTHVQQHRPCSLHSHSAAGPLQFALIHSSRARAVRTHTQSAEPQFAMVNSLPSQYGACSHEIL